MSKLYSKLFKWSLILYRIPITIISVYHYIQDRLYIDDTFYSEEFKYVLKKYLFTDFKKDWIGRLYGIINPNIDINGNYNFNNIIIEIDGDNTNSNEYVKNWVYRQMNLIDQLFKIGRLYDYINVDFRHVGPTEQDNYLVVFDIASRKQLTSNLKILFWQILSYSIIILGLLKILF